MPSEDLMRAILAGPQAVEDEEEIGPAKPIGIPKTFRPFVKPLSGPMSADAAERRGAANTAREPYYDGSEFAPRTLSPEARARLQRAMAQAGLIGKNSTYRLGVWDETSVKAYKKVLSYANQGGLDADTALQELMMAPQFDAEGLESGLGGGAAPVEPGNVSRTTNPLSIEAQMQAVARERLGRKLNTKEVAKFAALYSGMEKGYNAKMNAAEDTVAAGGDVTIEEQAPLDVAADQFIDSNYANEAGGQDAYGYLGALKNLLGA